MRPKFYSFFFRPFADWKQALGNSQPHEKADGMKSVGARDTMLVSLSLSHCIHFFFYATVAVVLCRKP